jgi:hypothetical protein
MAWWLIFSISFDWPSKSITTPTRAIFFANFLINDEHVVANDNDDHEDAVSSKDSDAVNGKGNNKDGKDNNNSDYNEVVLVGQG